MKLFFTVIFLRFSACYAFNVQLGSGSSFEIIDNAENQLTNTANGELSELNNTVSILKYLYLLLFPEIKN